MIYGTGPQQLENQSVGEYAASLKSRILAAFELVRRNVSKHHVYQKELYDQRVHGQPFNTGDWVWLYSPAIGRGVAINLIVHGKDLTLLRRRFLM